MLLSLAMNLLALLIVLGLCWLAMVWLNGRFHGQGHDVHIVALPVTDFEPGMPCVTCEGVGAVRDSRALAPCPDCAGTGEY